MKTVAYTRVSKIDQDLKNQRYEILEYINRYNNIHTDHKIPQIDEFIEIEVSSRRNEKQRRIDELKNILESGDTLIVTELSRLGRSTIEVLTIIEHLISRNIRIIAIKQKIDTVENDMTSKIMINMFCIMSELERDLISLRTKEALAAKKAQGIKLGLPKGTVLRSKFDKCRTDIIAYLNLGLNAAQIAEKLGLTSALQLRKYIAKHDLKKVAKEVGIGYDIKLTTNDNNITNISKPRMNTHEQHGSRVAQLI
ncbi:recombinase family protein [Cysteiniphilum sp. 6C5]|uniref:recombinase family protein n=1 Tax=unclassified Cysteiniphilum TaxID=2610889 RepID=UPI003F85175A